MKTAKQIAKELRDKGLKVQATAVERVIVYLKYEIAFNEIICLRPIVATGRGKYARYENRTAEMTSILDKLGVSYEVGNDAPKGGKTGATIKFNRADLFLALS